MDTIDISALKTDFLEHSYYGDHKSVISDLYYLLRGTPTGQRFGLRQETARSGLYWQFKPGM